MQDIYDIPIPLIEDPFYFPDTLIKVFDTVFSEVMFITKEILKETKSIPCENTI